MLTRVSYTVISLETPIITIYNSLPDQGYLSGCVYHSVLFGMVA